MKAERRRDGEDGGGMGDGEGGGGVMAKAATAKSCVGLASGGRCIGAARLRCMCGQSQRERLEIPLRAARRGGHDRGRDRR